MPGGSGRPIGPKSAPGDSVLDVCCGTGDLAFELAEPGVAGRPRRRLRLLRADARSRPGEGCEPGGRSRFASSGRMRCSCPMTTGASMRSPSASASATSPISTGACGRCAAFCARAGGWSSSRSPSRRRPPFSTFYSLWFDRIVPVLGSAHRRPGGLLATCAESVRSFPEPARARREDGRRRAASASAGLLIAGRDHRDSQRRRRAGE